MNTLLLIGNSGLYLCAVVLIAGCATTGFNEMTRPNTSTTQAEQDRNECWRFASNKYPKDVQDIMAGKIHTSCTTYKNNTTCTSEPYEPHYYDVNTKNRYDTAVACMKQRGYK
jgi:major membrane immunogen (membrane-anchored lipoprotein)